MFYFFFRATSCQVVSRGVYDDLTMPVFAIEKSRVEHKISREFIILTLKWLYLWSETGNQISRLPLESGLDMCTV